MRHIPHTVLAILLLAGLPTAAQAGSYSDTQKHTYTGTGATHTFSFANLQPAAGPVKVRVELWGDYLSVDRDKFATVDIDGSTAGKVCETGCKPTCNRMAHTKNFQAPASTVADGRLDVTVTNNRYVAKCDRSIMQVTVAYKTDEPPTVKSQELRLPEDTPTSITLAGTDPEGATLTWTITDQPSHGTLSGSAPNLTYTPDANFNGNDEFRFTASDGRSTSDPGTASLIVEPVNDPPTWVTPADERYTVDAGDPLELTAEATDPDEDTLDYRIDVQPDGSQFDAGTGDFTWTPTTEQIGTHTAAFSATDGEASIVRAVTIEVIGPEPGDTGPDAGDTGPVADTRSDTAPDATTPDLGAAEPDPQPSYELQGGGCSQGQGGVVGAWALWFFLFSWSAGSLARFSSRRF
jgi:hypothetical protein